LRLDTTIWHGCYEGSWKGQIVDAAFRHPAKFAPSLIRRIIKHGLAQGWWKQGDLLGDPFGGVACGGIVAASYGLRWIGVELEAEFVELGKQNINLHRRAWEHMGDPFPVLVQGDSRQFATVVKGAGAIVTSPPFTQGYSSGGGINKKGYGADGADKVGQRTYQGTGAERMDGNIETLPVGDLAAVLTSPPYADSVNSGESGIDWKKAGRPERDAPAGSRHGVQGASMHEMRYGATAGQIGALKDKGDSYWEATSQVYRQCLLALKPGGVMAVVVKSYIKGGKIVDLPGQTWTLLQHLGFEPSERIRAMLVKEKRHKTLFGDEHVERTERKSFFRRLAEKRGSPPIDFEEVLVVAKSEKY